MADEKMRLQNHNGRVRKDGSAYSPKHGEHTQPAEHIYPEKTKDNWTWTWDGEPDFDRAELKYYMQNYKEHLDAQNNRYAKKGNNDRIIDMDKYRKRKNSCPEETIMSIGKAGQTVEPAVLLDVVSDYLNWHMQQFPAVKILDVALHLDEPDAAPHIHVRKVWEGLDRDGYKCVGQNKALARMGVQAPDKNKKQGTRYNNAKQTYSAICRNKLLDMCRERGLDLEETPKEPSKSGLTLEKLKMQTMLAEEEKIQKQWRDAPKEPRFKLFHKKQYVSREQWEQREEYIAEQVQRAETAEQETERLKSENTRLQRHCGETEKQLDKAEQEIERLRGVYWETTREKNKQIEQAEQIMKFAKTHDGQNALEIFDQMRYGKPKKKKLRNKSKEDSER